MGRRDVSVIICTFKRPDSLAQTLQFLADADHSGLDVEAIVVENGPAVGAKGVVDQMGDKLSCRYVHEPRPGKEAALNCGIRQDGLGRIVAFLDDDMSPEAGWWKGVVAIADRHPECDYFTGRTYIVWPQEHVPGWAKVYAVQCWAHSILDYGRTDHVFAAGEWPCPNMFWLRHGVLEAGRRFDERLTAWINSGDIDFLLRLSEEGLKGVAGPDAAAGHRIQPELLDLAALRRRAFRIGRALSRVRRDKVATLPQARLRSNHPWIFRVMSVGNLARWSAVYLMAFTKLSRDARIVQRLVALLGIGNNLEGLF